MPYIIYDLEFTVSRNARYSSEIIDIGAVKVKEGPDGLYVSDTFHTYVRPRISRYCPPTPFNLPELRKRY